MKEIIEQKWFINLATSLIIVVIGYLLYLLINTFIIKRLEKKNTSFLKPNKKIALIKHLRTIIKSLLLIVICIIVLGIYGIDLSSTIASLGVVSIVVGFAVQDVLKDIIRGFIIMSDSYYKVGDIIKYADIEGKVLSVGLRTTKVEDSRTLNIVSISNRNIEKVEIISNLITVVVPLPYELKVNDAERILNNIVNDIKKINNVDECVFSGLTNLSSSSLDYLIKITCEPSKKLQTRRDVLGVIVKGLEKNNISIPYNQLDIHEK